MTDLTPGQIAAARARADQAIAHLGEALTAMTDLARTALLEHDPETVAAALNKQVRAHYAGPEDQAQTLALLALAVTRLAQALNRAAQPGGDDDA